jgi:hypothetical protein
MSSEILRHVVRQNLTDVSEVAGFRATALVMEAVRTFEK